MRYFCIFIFSFFVFAAQALSIIPMPREYETLLGGFFVLTDKCKVSVDSKSLEPIANALETKLYELSGIDLKLVKRGKQSIYLTIDPEVATAADGYFLSIGTKQIVVTGYDQAGVFYGVQTLLQCLEVEQSNQNTLGKVVKAPIMIADDLPATYYRAVRLNYSNEGIDIESLIKLIDELAYRKINFLHLPLNDSINWYYRSEIYPNLSRNVAYSIDKSELERVMLYAKERYVTIVPEIVCQVDSASYSDAYPSVFNSQDSYQIGSRWCLQKDMCCLNHPSLYALMSKQVEELETLFAGGLLFLNDEKGCKSRFAISTEPQKKMAQVKIYNLLFPLNKDARSNMYKQQHSFIEDATLEDFAEQHWVLPELQDSIDVKERVASTLE